MIRLTDLTFLVLQLNSAIDSGMYDELSLDEVHRHIEAGNLLRWLKDTIQYFDASLWLDRNGALING